MKAVVAAFNQEKARVGAFSVIMNLRMELFQALVLTLLTTLDLATQLMGNFIIAQFLSVIVTMPGPGRAWCRPRLCWNIGQVATALFISSIEIYQSINSVLVVFMIHFMFMPGLISVAW